MAITRIGSLIEFQAGTGNTGSTAITVPADAEVIIVAVHGYNGSTVNYFSTGLLTIDGNDCTLKLGQGDGSLSWFMGAMFARDVRSLTGSRTLGWDWGGVAAGDVTPRLVYGFYKGVDNAAPFGDSDGIQAAAVAYTTPSMTAVSGSLIVAWGWTSTGAALGSPTWSNAASVTDYLTLYGGGGGTWAEGSPSGNTTVAITAWTNSGDGGVCAIVLSVSTAAPTPHQRMGFQLR